MRTAFTHYPANFYNNHYWSYKLVMETIRQLWHCTQQSSLASTVLAVVYTNYLTGTVAKTLRLPLSLTDHSSITQHIAKTFCFGGRKRDAGSQCVTLISFPRVHQWLHS